MADYNIKADITANTKGYEAGIKKAQESTKKFSASLSKVIQGLGKNGLVGAMGSIGLASAGLSATLGAVVKIAKQVSQAIGECTEAYKKQLIAERQLETAINNNPLVTGSAKKRLTEFASEMQKVSNYGDEELIPMMANLVSLGRTEEETMKIMAVAMDMSASGSMSLDTAINQLNATLNGNIGRLGQQNAELKGLTEEELKSGKAIEILGEKFKGLSQATLDTSKQLKNIKGDFKEAIGEFTLPSSDMWNNFWIGFYDKGISVIKQFDEYMDKTIIGKGIAEELIKGYKTISDERQKILYLEDNIHALSESQIVALQKHLESTKNRNKEQEELLRKVKMEVEARTYLAKIYEDMDREEAERQKTEEEQLAIENEIAILKGKYLEKMAEQERKWKNIKDVTGEEVKNEEKIKFYQDSLVDLMTQAGGQITTNNQLYKDQIKIIEQLQSTLAEPVEAEEEKKTSDTWTKKIREQAISRLEAEKEEMAQRLELTGYTEEQKVEILQKYNAQLFELNRERIIAEREEAIKSVEDFANAEEEKERIMEYYQNLLIENAKKYPQEYKKAGEKSATSFAEGFKKVVKKLEPTLKQIGKALQSIGKIAKSMFQGGKSIFTKLFNIDTDTVLDSILKIEDKILTFFVETVPKLPRFVASAMQSISVLLTSVLQVVTPEKVTELIVGIMNTIAEYAPVIIQTIADVMTNMLDGLINSMPEILKTLNVIVGKIAEVLPQLIEKLIQAFIAILQNPEEIASLVVALIKGFVEIINVLIRNLAPLLKALLPAIGTIILELIKAIPELLVSMAESIGEALKEIGKYIVNLLIDILNKMLDGISKAWTWTGAKGIPHIKHLATGTQNAQRGLTLVGEAGPELVAFNGGEQVLNNRNTQKAIAGMSGNTNTFNVTFNNTMDTTAYAMMSQLRQYNRELAINGVI
jgi:phage-related protein